MKIFYSDKHELHSPQWYVADGTVRPCPDSPERVGRILGALRGAGGFEVVGVEGVDPWGAIRGVHAGEYLEYLRTIHGVWWGEFGVDVVPDTFVRRAGMKRPSKPAAQAGYYCFDMAAPITAGTYGAAVGAAACAVAAAEAVMGGARVAYALCRPPGHHAGADYCGGFCYLNNAAVAAQRLRLAGKKRVAVLDVDYHHGNGTQDIFYARRDVLFVSMHAEPGTQYPYFWGHAEETGEGEGVGFNVNFPLARGTGEGVWLETLARALGRVGDFGAEGLVVSLGVDAFEKDTVGDFGVTVAGYREAGRMVRALGVPTVWVQEGGYNLEAVGGCVTAVLGAFSY